MNLRTKRLVAKQKLIEAQLKRTNKARLNNKIEARMSKIHGIGVFAIKDIKKGERIIEYKGELIDKEISEERSEKGHDGQRGEIYIFTLNDEVDIDGAVGGNGSQFINHSCNPNAEAVIEDETAIFIEAIKDIKEGEEISYDYGYDVDDYLNHECKCGATNCFGFILGEEHRSKVKKS